jgi:tRNA G37 N-methylase Trm5
VEVSCGDRDVCVKGLERVLCNDIDPAAVESIRRNAALNGVDPAVLTPCQGSQLPLFGDKANCC